MPVIYINRKKENILHCRYGTLDNFGKCKISRIYISIFLSKEVVILLSISSAVYACNARNLWKRDNMRIQEKV